MLVGLDVRVWMGSVAGWGVDLEGTNDEFLLFGIFGFLSVWDDSWGGCGKVRSRSSGYSWVWGGRNNTCDSNLLWWFCEFVWFWCFCQERSIKLGCWWWWCCAVLLACLLCLINCRRELFKSSLCLTIYVVVLRGLYRIDLFACFIIPMAFPYVLFEQAFDSSHHQLCSRLWGWFPFTRIPPSYFERQFDTHRKRNVTHPRTEFLWVSWKMVQAIATQRRSSSSRLCV